MDLQKLMDLGMDAATAIYSDDASAIGRDRNRYHEAVASQDVWTLEQVDAAVKVSMEDAIKRINERTANK